MDLTAFETDGVLDVATAARAGVDEATLRTLVRNGALRRLARGRYTTRVDATGEPLHLLRTIAHVASFGGRAVASHHSAVLAHGLPLVHTDLDTVRLCRTSAGSRRRRPGLAVDGPAGAPVTVWTRSLTAGLVTVHPTVAVVQHGCVNGPGAALVAADAALRLDRVTTKGLDDAVASMVRHAGIGPVRAALCLADGRRESPGESLTALLLAGLGHSTTPQVEIVAAGHPYRVDLLIDGTTVVVEFDGLLKYATREDLVREKRREDDLRAAGYEVVRVTWADLANPARVRALVAAAIARSHRRPSGVA